MNTYDVVVLGGGPGGYAAALRSRWHGLRVAILEAGDVGGTCLHRGCVPSKALLHIARLADSIDELDDLGLVTRAGPVDINAAGRFRDHVVSRLHTGLEGLLKANEVDIIQGWGNITAPGRVHVAGPDIDLEAEHVVLVAVGRRPATADCGLDDLGVLDAHGFIDVDEIGRSAVTGVWAVGDCIPTLALAHAAFAEGFVVADAIAGKDPEPVVRHLIPRVTYSTPEVASVGWTEPEARERFGDAVYCTTTSLAGNARTIIEEATGHVKLVTLTDGTVVGAHVVGPGATELIGELAVVVGWEGLASELADVIHAHPTVSEGIREAALAAGGTPFHVHG